MSRTFQMVKNLSAMQETQVWSLGWEDPLEKEVATHSNILAWRIPWTEEPVGLEAIGSISKHDCKKNYLNHLTICSIHYIYIYTGFPSGSVVKNPPTNAGNKGDEGSISSLGRSPGRGNGNSLQYPCQDSSMDRRACWARVHRITKSQTWLKGLGTHRWH